MCRCVDAINSIRWPLLGLVAVVMAFGGAARAEDLADYLDRRGMDRLLALHLEEQVEAALEPAQRERLALRLAEVYARLLEQSNDEASMQDLEERGRRLLTLVPPTGAAELRLAVLRASYRSAALACEAHRLRRADAEQLARAAATLDRIVPELLELRTSIDEVTAALQRRLSRAAGVEAALLADEVDQQARLKAQSTFIAAWAQYYRGWLAGDPAKAVGADPLFVELLDTGQSQPQPRDVSEDLRGLESYARSILGLALTRGLTQRASVAEDWLALLDHPETFAPLRHELPAWRLAVALDAGDYDGAVQRLEAALALPERAPTAWVRMAAARGLEAAIDPVRDPAARRLADRAVAELASRGELAEVLDLSRRYGTAALGSGGFAFAYVRGVEAFEQVRRDYPGDGPAPDLSTRRRFLDAAQLLATALEQPDAAAYTGAASGCRALVGWCRYYGGDPLAAAAFFEQAAEQQLPQEAAVSMWMAIVSLEAARRDGHEEARPQLAALRDRFLERFPSSEHAPRLQLQRILDGGRPSLQAVEALRAIPPGNDAYAEAQRQSLQMLYLLFRGATGEARRELGARFLSAARPLLEDDELLVASAAASPAMRAAVMVRARQTLEVALAPGVERSDVAAWALALLDRLGMVDGDSSIAVLDELDVRRLQMAVLQGDTARAIALADGVVGRSPASAWADVAARTVFRDALRRWDASEPGSPDEGAALAAAIRFGESILAGIDDGTIAGDGGLASCLATVGRARTRAWERSGDANEAEQAFAQTERLLGMRPNDVEALRNAAVLAEALGRRDLALERLRRLLAAAPSGTPAWFEAKWRLVRLLAEIDPARAREVLDQHRQLNPEFGPDPWGERLRELDRRLPRAVRPEDAEIDPSAGKGADA